MFLIALRIVFILSIAYSFGLLVAWLILVFQNANNRGLHSEDNEPMLNMQLDHHNPSQKQLPKKRWVEVDESYYLAEFVLDQNNKED